jgi:CYTH domain-containing protein
MEIERKFLVAEKDLPDDLASYPSHQLEQAYLCTSPVVRVRKEDDTYYLTYKSKGLLSREEYNLPLNEEAYQHLLEKADGIVLSKKRYRIPEKDGLTIELDLFDAPYEGLYLAEVEFSSEEEANAFLPPEWFGEDVTFSGMYHNSYLSQLPQ